MAGSYGSLITIAKRIFIWMDLMKDWCAKPAINRWLKERSAYQPGAMAVTRGRIFIEEGLAADASAVM